MSVNGDAPASIRQLIAIIATHLVDMILSDPEREALSFLLHSELYGDCVDFIRKALTHEIANGLILAATDPRDEVRQRASELLSRIRCLCAHR